MARNWIKIETVTPAKPEVCVMATHLKMDSDMVMGKLVRLWSWAEVNRIKSNDLGVTREFIDKLAGKKGFAAAMERCGWLKEEAGRLSFPHFDRHNGPTGKGRALTAMRVARHRQKKRDDHETEVPSEVENRESIVTETAASPVVAKTEDEMASAPSVETAPQREAVEEAWSTMEADGEAELSARETSLEAEASDGGDELPAVEEEPRKKRGKSGAAGSRKVAVAEPPDQPLLFGL